MSETRAQEHGLQLAQVEAIAARDQNGLARDQLIAFVRAYYEAAPQEVLAGVHPPDLYAIARSHFEMARLRKADEHLIRVYRPDAGRDGWSADVCVLETCVPDMPFLVDSIIIAVRAVGGIVRWLVHPVLDLRRGSQGEVTAIEAAEEGRCGLESLVHLHFEADLDEAGLESLRASVAQTLADTALVVNDFGAMRAKLQERVQDLETVPPDMDPDDIAEVRAFLQWLDEDHFTFLGYAESAISGAGENSHFEHVAGSELGLQRAKDGEIDLIAPLAELDKYAQSRRPIVVTRANTRSHIHHHEYFDSVSVKRFAADGSASGTCRFIGLFSSEVYNSLARRIPYLRRKIQWVMSQSKLREGSHAAKQLQEILDSLPRDELFQSSEQELLELALGIRALRETQRLRLFLRRDRYGRFFACLVFLPRDEYTPDLRARLGQLLLELLNGREIEHHVQLQRDGLARISFTIRTAPGSQSPLTARELEQRLHEATRSWDDALRDYLCRVLPDDQARSLSTRFRHAFPAAYRDQTAPVDAAIDLQYLDRLDDEQSLLARLLPLDDPDAVTLKVYVNQKPALLSDLLPMLENFGLTVLSQHPYKVALRGGQTRWIQDFSLRVQGPISGQGEQIRTRFEEAFLQCWRGELENDGLNRLVLGAGLDGRRVVLVRCLCKYLLQTGLPFSQAYIEDMLADNVRLIRDMVSLFAARFEPGRTDEASAERLHGEVLAALDEVSSLDADRFLRAMLSVVDACLRTNFYQAAQDGRPKPYISIKLNPREIPELPRPRPVFEAFVYAPDVEGVHLRGGKVARGGLRWSDRREDFRTEVLGLVKAQMVKNAVIVPVGAKGGFVVKRRLAGLSREQFMQAGIACYKTFIRGLLDITDNYVEGQIQPPPDVVRRDDDDPYLVVAADKGTASFSDIANSVSAEYDFWLGDAFASGGSAGYDHKKMGITARGAWESVKRHFREMGRDCQREPFTCVGIGDMGGDVFGNGMLLSQQIRLLAAFNHLHIFIDPDPDPAISHAERKRLFELPRSAWTDYDRELISKGGGVYERSAKQITLSAEAREALGIDQTSLTPTELISELLKAPVDLLWNGGIGTYVKARSESHLDVGDRANDALRVDGRELRCQMMGEGGNLGLTQLGRIEFALNGGRVITDANDNAGGVNSSDREVNIKIPLNGLLADGTMTRADRDALLESMTEEVAGDVLRDNYLQTQGLCQLRRNAAERLDEHTDYMALLEHDGLLDRALEFLPDDETLKDRRAARQGLTLPELSVLVSYGKIALFDAVLASSLPDDPALEAFLLDYFPSALAASAPAALREHRLRRQIIATVTTNELVNRMGPTFAFRAAEDIGVSRDRPVKAYLAAREIFEATKIFAEIEATDGSLDTQAQYQLLDRVAGLLKFAATWLLTQWDLDQPLAEIVAAFQPTIAALRDNLDDVLAPSFSAQHAGQLARMRKAQAPESVARGFADLHILGSGLDVAVLVANHQLPVDELARVYFALGDQLRTPWLVNSVLSLPVTNRWQAMARYSLRDECYETHRKLVDTVLHQAGDSAEERMRNWTQSHGQALAFVQRRLGEIEAQASTDFASLSVALRELKRLGQ